MKNKIFNDLISDIEIASTHMYYKEVSSTNYKIYKEFKVKYDKITDNNKTWDISEHNEKDNEKYINYWTNHRYYATIAVIFQALAVESYINYYGLKKLGSKKFNEHYEKIATVDKYVIIYEVVNKKEFPKSDSAYGNLKMLFKLRNSLVHSKAQEINMIDDDLEAFMDNLSKLFGGPKNNIFSEIDNIIKTYDQIISIMNY